jgi:hypothetical protein
MNCVIGARWKKWPRATCNLWAHNVDLATMFFFPLSLSLQLGVVPQIWQTWNDLSTASEGVKMHLSQASARRRLVALRIMTEQRFSDATWGFRNNLCKGVGQDHSKSMTQGIANVICFPSYLSNVHGMVAIFLISTWNYMELNVGAINSHRSYLYRHYRLYYYMYHEYHHTINFIN